MGQKERPEWGASPAKPSKPLRTEARESFSSWSAYGVLLVVLRIRSRPFSTGLCSRVYLSARHARAANPRASFTG